MRRRQGLRRIGLLGGSFNPAHDGHLHISRAALALLGLHEVWWMVSPQNPLKGTSDMASLEARLDSAERVARRDSRIRVTAVEAELGTVYTADTLAALTRHFPAIRFVWLMGADNLAQIEKWRGWRSIFGTVPIAVFDRPAYSLRALASRAARRFAKARVSDAQARDMADMRPPAWVFLRTRWNPRSASSLRNRGRWRP